MILAAVWRKKIRLECLAMGDLRAISSVEVLFIVSVIVWSVSLSCSVEGGLMVPCSLTLKEVCDSGLV